MNRFALTLPLAAAILAGGCTKKADPAATTAAAPAPIEVKTASAEERTIERSMAATGSLLPDDTVTLVSEVQGKIIRIHADFGQAVRQGAVLVELDPTEYDLQIARSRGTLNQSLARLGLPAYTGKLTMPESTPALRQVTAQFEDAKFKFDNAAKLVKSGDISQERYTELEKGFRAREAAVEAARDEMRTAWMSVVSQEADLKIYEKRRRDTVIRAPFDGEVGERQAAVGQFVKDNTALIKIVKTHPLRLRAEIPEGAAGGVHIGSQLTFTTDALPGTEFTAVVREMNPSLDSRSRTLQAEARLVKPDARLRPGMFVQVRLVTQKEVKVVVVPKRALYNVAGLTKVFVVDGGTARLVTFNPGIELGDFVEVPGDVIKPGSKVAISQLGALTSGAKVRM